MIPLERNIPLMSPGLSEIYPLFYGWEQCDGGHSYGPAVREYFLIHHVLSGKGSFSCGKTYCLKQGQCFLICPGDVTFYKADQNDPWAYCWVAFGGELAEMLLKKAGLGREKPVFENEKVTELFRGLCVRIRNHDISWDGAGMTLLSMIFAMFSFLPQKNSVRTEREKYIDKAKSYISSMLQAPFTVEQLAQYCRLDRHYLCRIFKQQTGLTLQQYIIRLRMRKAAGLLRSSTLSVGDIARSVGYGDVYNFSKMFKKQIGLSPRCYRKERGEKA